MILYSRQPARSQAFTLIELMVVMTLMAIMAALVATEMRGTFEDALLRSTARKIISVCNLANSRAISLNQPQIVRLDFERGRYLIESPLPDSEGRQILPQDQLEGDGELDKRIAIQLKKSDGSVDESQTERAGDNESENSTSRADEIRFNPDGTAEGADILLRDRQGFETILRLNPVTSRIRALGIARSENR